MQSEQALLSWTPYSSPPFGQSQFTGSRQDNASHCVCNKANEGTMANRLIPSMDMTLLFVMQLVIWGAKFLNPLQLFEWTAVNNVCLNCNKQNVN